MSSDSATVTLFLLLPRVCLDCESWSVDRWRTELPALFGHLHTSIRQAFISNYASPNAPAPTNAFTNAKPAAESRHIDARGIVRNANGDPIHGGSTATVVVMVKDANGAGANLITANVGDSTAFLVPTRGTWDFLSVDHGPENQEEWERVNTSVEESHLYQTKLLFVYDKTNVYRKYECPNVFLGDGTKDQQYVANPWGYGLHPTNVRYEPAVYAVTPRTVSKDSTCIAMTRALGDFYAHQFGLTHVPSVSVKRISCADSVSTDTTQAHTNSYATQEQAYTIFVASDGVWDCFTEDHQLMTEEGFMFLDQLLAREADGTLPRIGTFNPDAETLEYRQLAHGPDGRYIYVKPKATYSVVNFESESESARWCDDVAPSEKRTPTDGISLTVTAGHDMFVKGDREVPFRKVKARELVGSDDNDSAITLLAAASRGFNAAATTPGVPLVLAESLGLTTSERLDAFLEVYGHWLATGALIHTGAGGDDRAISLHPVDARDAAVLADRLARAGLTESSDFTTAHAADEIRVHASHWTTYFFRQYGTLCKEAIVDDVTPVAATLEERAAAEDALERAQIASVRAASHDAKWLWWWTLQRLDKRQVRLLLAGLQRAAGTANPAPHGGELRTHSAELRDQLLRACMHAGYAAHFDRDGDAQSAEWRLTFSDATDCVEPSLPSSRVRAREAHGRVFCVNVPPHHLIVARRARAVPADKSSATATAPVVLQASRPLVTGNCWRYDDLMQFINDELITNGKGLLAMGEAVLEESIARAITNFGSKHYDDACLVAWQFTPTKPTPGDNQQQANGNDSMAI